MLKSTLTAVAIVLILSASASGASAQAAAAKKVLGACKPDIKAFCADVAPGEGRIKACMKRRLPELSEPCKEALFQAWLNK
ncbi:cysteine rich repeat-containing protein [Rhodoblastus sp.]|uniref:cysteine rich repeat-containing protein n=1 Tax=Rhodoblastus sp. TaxID=1962975 RepID=UPI003F9870F8